MNTRAQFRYSRKTILALLATAAAALAVCIAAPLLKYGGDVPAQASPAQNERMINHYSPNAASSQENGEKNLAEGPDEEEYLITVHNGKIGVFRRRESSPFVTADVDVYLLPEEDVKILRRGIRVRGFSAVKSVLEDYE